MQWGYLTPGPLFPLLSLSCWPFKRGILVRVEDRTVQQTVQQIAEVAQRITANVEHVIIGKGDAVRLTLIAVLCRGHVLI